MSDQQFYRLQNMLAGWRCYMDELVEDDPRSAELRQERDAVRRAYQDSFEATGPQQTIEPSEEWVRFFIAERVIPLIFSGHLPPPTEERGE